MAVINVILRPHKVSFLFLVCRVGQFSLSYLTYVIRCNQFQHATTMFTQPVLIVFTIQASIFGSLDTQVSAFCSLVPRPHPPIAFCCLYTIFFQLWFLKKLKKRLVAWSFLSDLWDQKQENNFVWP